MKFSSTDSNILAAMGFGLALFVGLAFASIARPNAHGQAANAMVTATPAACATTARC